MASPAITWSTNQSFTVKLPAAPSSDVKITFAQDEAVFTPSTLTFTTQNWNTAQTVNVRLAEEPPAAPPCPWPWCPPFNPLPVQVVLTINSEQIWVNATTVTVTGLTNNTSYTLQVRAVNVSGNGASSQVSATPVPPPAKPTGFTAAAKDASVDLAWTDPSNSTITRWEYQYKTAGSYGSWTAVPSSSATTTSYTVSSLTNNTAHTFRIRAVNDSGDGTASDEVSATPLPPPAAPAGFSATPKTGKTPIALYTEGQVDLSWTDPGNTSITKWQYQYKSKPDGGSYGSYGSWTDICVTSSDSNCPTKTAYTVTGLTLGTEYKFKLRAVNATGDGAASESGAAKPVLPTPDKPTGLTATPKISSVDLAWTNPNNSTITGWKYRQKMGNTWGSWTSIPLSHSGTTSYTVRSLTNDTTYRFKIRAVNGAGDGTESDESAAAIPRALPAKPTGFTATGGNTEVDLAWTNPNNFSITSWEYRYKSTGGYGSWTAMTSSSQTTTSYTVTGLTNNTKHTFEIRAVNSSGGGAASDEASAVPVAGAPGAPTLTAAGGEEQVVLTWTKNSGGRWVVKWQYQYKSTGSYGSWTDVPSSGDSTRSYTVTGLDNGESYSFKVRGVNDAGNGTASGEDSADTAPAAPTGFSATPKANSMDLAWTDPGDSTITGWEYRYIGSGGWTGWTSISGSGATTTSYTKTGLTNGTEYTFQIRAVNSSGNGTASAGKKATPRPAPAAPDLKSATPGHAQVTLTWTYDSSSAAATGYQYSKDGGSTWTAATVTGTVGTITYTVTSLTNSTEYTFKVRGVNAYGNGAESVGVKATPIAKPAKPAGFTATAKDKAVDLAWTDPSNSTITGWEYQYKTDGAYGSWTDVPNSTASTTSYTVTDLTNDTAHTFKIRAVNASGDGVESDEKSATPKSAPAKPTGFTAAAKHQSADLSWTDPGDSSITKWEYQQKSGGGNYGSWTTMSTSATATSYTVRSLTNNTTYTFRIRAWNAYGNGPTSDERTATPVPAPAAPTGLTAAAKHQSVVLAWTDPNNSTITGWEYQYKTDSGYGSWTAMTSSSATTTSYTVTGLTNNTAHTFKIRAVNGSGDGAASAEVSATPRPVPSAPANLTAAPSMSSSARATLRWDRHSDTTITKWQLRQWSGNGADFVVGTGSSQEVTLEWNNPNKSNILFWDYRQRADGGSWGNWSQISHDPNTTSHTFTTTMTSGTRFHHQVRAAVSGEVSHTATGLKAWSKITPTTPPNKLGHNATGLTHNMEYNFQVRAVNASGNGHAASTKARPVAGRPGAPTLTAAGGDEQVTLTWTKHSDGKWADKWQYQYKSTGGYGSWKDVPSSGDSTRSYTVTGLDNGKTYTFRVRGVNAAGNGVESSEVSVSTQPAKPAGLTAAAKTGKTPVVPVHRGPG